MPRILIWSPNYAPELTGIPPLVTDIAEWLVERDHRVDVVTAFPNYPERRIHAGYRKRLWVSEWRNGVHVYRSWLRAVPERTLIDKALYELTISTFSLPNAIRLARRADVIVCLIPTLLAASYATLIARLARRRLVLWVQDLVLEAGLSVVGQRGARALAAASRLERFAFLSADKIVVCSPGFQSYIALSVNRSVEDLDIATIYNWADLQRIQPMMARVPSVPAQFLYAGNIGFTQGLETLVDAARIAGDGISVRIVGSGNASSGLARFARGVPNVEIQPPVAQDEYPALLVSADAHLVIQRKMSETANLPSKIATSLASGRPIIGSIGLETPAAQLLRASGAAILVEPESSEALAAAMCELAQDPKRQTRLGRAARSFAEMHLGKGPALELLEAAIVG